MAVPAARPPIPPTALIGREGEIARVRELLGESRLVTLTGPGGTGKTRLGLAVLADLEGAYPDGVAFVDLAPLADPVLVPSAIAQALDVKAQGGRPVEQTPQTFLARRELLLCLDNFEHVLAAGPFVSRLLASVPGLAVLTTSRAPLRLAGEREHFGLATSAAMTPLTRTGELLGTLAYLAPEQIRPAPVDGRADQYSLACVLFECLVGEPPFPRETDAQLLWAHVQERPPSLMEKRPGLPDGLVEVVAKRAGQGARRPLPDLRGVGRGHARRAAERGGLTGRGQHWSRQCG
jgi:hypothetical protein